MYRIKGMNDLVILVKRIYIKRIYISSAEDFKGFK